MGILKRFWRDYHLETFAITISILLVISTYILYKRGTLAQGFIPIVSAGFLFVIAQLYGRLKDRRDAKRKRAQDLFLEWHSQEIRESRIYLSRWRLNIDKNKKLPPLGKIESNAANDYQVKYKNKTNNKSKNKEIETHELDNFELQEFHAFKLYQFFERWMLLVKNNDIDYQSADQYMISYKDWWLDNFIVAWMEKEADKYIYDSLNEILIYLRPKKRSYKFWMKSDKVKEEFPKDVKKKETSN